MNEQRVLEVQKEVTATLRASGGQMRRRDLEHALHVERLGTNLWLSAYVGLKNDNAISEYGSGLKTDPVFVTLKGF
jgi:hypothetical protein